MNRRVLAVTLVALGCRSFNYDSQLGPRYASVEPPTPVLLAAPMVTDTVRLVTFNIQYAIHVDRAITLLRSSPELRTADIVTLQEMDAPGVQAIAESLAMSYVYYPATIEHQTHRDFGNAILSRWPIVADQKILLPHLARFERTRRIATAATVAVRGVPLRVYSVHLGTRFEIGPGSRRDQVRAILADAATYPRVVISGDMNSHGIGRLVRAAGFAWPTERNPHTRWIFNWDHIFTKGLTPGPPPASGVVRDTLHASDHRPVWALALIAAR